MYKFNAFLANLGIEILSTISGYKNLYLLKSNNTQPILGKHINKYTRISIPAIKDAYEKLQTVNCESSVSIKHIFELDGELCIVMEYVDWSNLNKYMKEKYFPKMDFNMREFRRIFRNIAHAIDKLHTHNLIHGDVHGLNILINEKFEIKIIDFDFAFIGGDKSDIDSYKSMDILRYNSLLFEFIFEQIYLNERYNLFSNSDAKEKKEHFSKIELQHKTFNSCLDVYSNIFGVNS